MYIPPHSQLPGRVHAALQYLDYTRFLLTDGDGAIKDRQLTSQEQRVKDSALQVLAEYFNSDDKGDTSGPAAAPTVGPEMPVPVPK